MKLDKHKAAQRIVRYVNAVNDTFTGADVGIDGQSMRELWQRGFITRERRAGRKDAWMYRLNTDHTTIMHLAGD